MSKANYLVYCHVNRASGKAYVGITKQTPSERWKSGAGYTRQAFHAAIEELGWNAFEHKVLVDGLTKEEAEYFETFYIDFYDSCDNGYNADYADGPLDALCGEYYRKNSLAPEGDELLKLYREKGTVDIEQLQWVASMLEKCQLNDKIFGD